MEKAGNIPILLAKKTAEDMIEIISGTLMLFLSAFVYFYIPGTPVPITLQVFSVLMISIIYSKKNSLIATSAYIFLGACGFPVFAGATGGLFHLFGPTGGYLIGFLASSYMVPRIRKKIGLLPSLFAGLITIYSLGWLQLSIFMHMNLYKAFSLGVAPFIVYDILKLAVVYLIAKFKRGI